MSSDEATTRPSNFRVVAAVLVSLGALALGFSSSLLMLPYQVDDSFIFYRYARNLLDGYGFRFNPHGVVVEGFSSPLWLALVCALAKLGGIARVPALTSAFGLGCSLLVGLLLLRSERARPWGVSWSACVLWCLGPTAVFYAIAGLETPLFLLVLLLSHGVGVQAHSRVSRLALLLAPWVRPEAPWIALTLSAQRALLGGWRSLKDREHLLELGALAAGGASLLLARLLVFHAVFPNTARAKEPRLFDGFTYVLAGLWTPWGLSLVVAGLLGAWLGTQRERAFLATAALWSVATLLEGGDWMPAFRLLAPSLLFLSLAATGMLLPQERPARQWASRLGVLLVLCGGGFAAFATIELAEAILEAHRSLDHENEVLHEELRGLRVRSIALVDIGALGFSLPNVELFDLAGLTEPAIAAAPGGLLRKRFPRGLLFAERRSDAIVLRVKEPPVLSAQGVPSATPALLFAPVERYLFEDPRFARDYVPWSAVGADTNRVPYYGRVIYLRRELAASRTPPTNRVRLVAPETYR